MAQKTSIAAMIKKTSIFESTLTRNKLMHLIATHLGQYEWLSPKNLPFLEAMVLHLAYVLDAEIWKFKSVKLVSGCEWSTYVKSIRSEVYLG